MIHICLTDKPEYLVHFKAIIDQKKGIMRLSKILKNISEFIKYVTVNVKNKVHEKNKNTSLCYNWKFHTSYITYIISIVKCALNDDSLR